MSEANDKPGAPTTEQARKLAHEAIDSASSQAEELEQRIRSEAKKLASQYRERKGEAHEQLDQSIESLEQFVRDKPMAAAGIAFAAGVLTTLLLRR